MQHLRCQLHWKMERRHSPRPVPLHCHWWKPESHRRGRQQLAARRARAGAAVHPHAQGKHVPPCMQYTQRAQPKLEASDVVQVQRRALPEQCKDA